MKCRGYWLMMIPWTVSACAAYELPRLNINHPANPAAVTASERPVSKTLAYAKADIPSQLPIASAAAAQQEGHDAHHQTNGAASKAVTGEGKVVAAVPASSQLVVEHGEIEGFMDAMTMGYRVEPPSLLEGLKPGEPSYMTMGTTGMDMGKMAEAMPYPRNTISMKGATGPFGDYISMGGLFTILKVRDALSSYDDDPGWYRHPVGTVAWKASDEGLRRDGIDATAPRVQLDNKGSDRNAAAHEH